MKQSILLIAASAYSVAGNPWEMPELVNLLSIIPGGAQAAEAPAAVEAHRRRLGHAWSSGGGDSWSSGSGNSWSSGSGNPWSSGSGNTWSSGSGNTWSSGSGSPWSSGGDGGDSARTRPGDSSSGSSESESGSSSGSSESESGSSSGSESESMDSESSESTEIDSSESTEIDSSESTESESSEPSDNGNDGGKNGNTGDKGENGNQGSKGGEGSNPKAKANEVTFEVRMCCMTKLQCEASGSAVKAALEITSTVKTTCTLVEDKTEGKKDKKDTATKRRLTDVLDAATTKSTWDVKYVIEADNETAPKYQKALKTDETTKKFKTNVEKLNGEALEKFEVKQELGSPKDEAEKGLSGGAVAGIVIGVLLGFACMGGGIYYYMDK